MQSNPAGDQVILASKSPRRKELLSGILKHFLTVEAQVEEASDSTSDSAGLALENARLKAETVADLHPDAWVIGSDTVVSCDGVSLGKPVDHDDAFRMIRQLSGRSHEVYSAVCIVHRKREVDISFVEKSQVRFFELSDSQIRDYVEAFHPTEYAGGYPIQHVMGSIVAGFSGSYSNIVGLPVERLRDTMQQCGILNTTSTES